MGRAVMRQPDGRLAVWSTFVDDFVLYDATPEEYEDWVVEQAVEEAKVQARRDLEAVEQRGTSSVAGRTFDKALATRNARHGLPQDDSDLPFAEWVEKHSDDLGISTEKVDYSDD